MSKRLLALLLTLILTLSCFVGCDLLDDFGGGGYDQYEEDDGADKKEPDKGVYGYASVEGIPDYSGKAYVELNGNMPEFTDKEIVSKSYEYYSELDSLGRCGYTMACVGKDIMPTEDRESISSVYPSGWENNKYDTDLVDGGYIYNRCHLIGFQLTGENANKSNLITGTRYLNIEGMLPFENMVADYVKETGNHVMYRVTPIFVGKNLLASGVKIEGFSVEDDGEGICFNVFAYNVQPGITINYATGENALNGDSLPEIDSETLSDAEAESGTATENTYILNLKTKKIHTPKCSSVTDMSELNKKEYHGTLEDLIDDGYTACGTCKPK